jgi:hypothetical protein
LFEPGRKYTLEEWKEIIAKNNGQTHTWTDTDSRAVSKGTVSLAENGYELDKLPWLVKIVPGEKKKSDEEIYPLPSGGISSVTRTVLVTLGCALILTAFILLLYSKRSKK